MPHDPQSLPWYAQDDLWSLTQKEWNPERNIYFESIFSQANGYLGVRAYPEETSKGLPSFREGYLAGVFAETDQAALQLTGVDYDWRMLAMITLPELFGCQIDLNGEIFQLTSGRLGAYSCTLSLATGELVRDLVWNSPSGKQTRLIFKRFLSAAIPHLGMQEISLTSLNWSGQAALDFKLDGGIPTLFRTGDRTQPHIPQDLLQDQKINKHSPGRGTVTFRTRGTDQLVAITSALVGGNPSLRPGKDGILAQTTTLPLQANQSEAVLHAVSVVHSRDPIKEKQIPRTSAQIAQDQASAGYRSALSASSAIWKDRWARSDIKIKGPPEDQVRIRYGIFQTLQAGPFHSDQISIPARGLSFNRYHGLYYWDSESFILPQFLYSHPEVARNLLNFRYHTLPGSQRNARYLEAPGACFPWMTDSDDGTEQAPWQLGDYLWHQNASIAYAIDHYVRATGDLDFLIDRGYEIIAESARFWISRLKEDQAGLLHMMPTVGPDEIDQPGPDNGYVSLLARKHLRIAVHWAEILSERSPATAARLLDRLALEISEIKSWDSAAARIHIPLVPDLDIPLQDKFLLDKKPLDFQGLTANEAFDMRHTHRVIKQADIILALGLLQEEFTLEQMRKAYDFYEPMTVHFSSLSYCSHAVMAAVIGRDEDAYDYFRKGAGLDLDDRREGPADGLHSAALAGNWQMVVYGFLGMRLTLQGLLLEPRLPRSWKSIRLTIAYRGYLLHLSLEGPDLELDVTAREAKDPARIILDGKSHSIRDGLRITRRFS